MAQVDSALEEIDEYLRRQFKTRLKTVLGRREFREPGLPGTVTCWDVAGETGRYWAFHGGLPLCVYPFQYQLGSEEEALNFHVGLVARVWASNPPPWARRKRKAGGRRP